jgi:hypothetical protein
MPRFILVLELIWNFSVLFTMNNSNEREYSLASVSTLNFLNSYLQETCLLTSAIILIIFLWMLNSLLLSVEFPQKITPYDMME